MESQHMQRKEIERFGIRVHGDTLRVIHRLMLAAALLGLFASVYLLIVYVTGGPIICGTNTGCEIVRASKWAYTYGIPRPVLGVAFYLAILAVLTKHAYAPSFHHRKFRLALLAATTFGFAESAFLTFVQWVDIGAFCSWCLTSAVAATAIFVLSWFDGREPPAKEVILRELKFIFHAFVAAVLLGGVALWLLLGKAAAGR